MVLENLVSIREALRHPFWMLVIGAVISLISLLFSYFIFPESIGLFTTVLITFAMTPFMVNLLIREEIMTEVDVKKKLTDSFFGRHKDILLVYMAFFGGMIIALSLTFIFLPDQTVNTVFNQQIKEIQLIRGNFLFSNTFTKILLNNIGVLVLTVLFSFVFGSGAIFILAWNASVLAAAIGLTAKSVGGVGGLPIALATYMPHGVFEIAAYFLAGISGGILSAAVMRRKSDYFNAVLKDSTKVLLIGFLLLVIGASIETILIG